MEYTITKTCNCEDAMTAFVHPKPDLKPGDVVEGKPMQNFYGEYLSVKSATGKHYYIKPDCAKPTTKPKEDK